jgi:hypothetical protein
MPLNYVRTSEARKGYEPLGDRGHTLSNLPVRSDKSVSITLRHYFREADFLDSNLFGRVAAFMQNMLMLIRLAVISLLFSATASFAAATKVDLGGMVLLVSDAPTAQIFHIVDPVLRQNSVRA